LAFALTPLSPPVLFSPSKPLDLVSKLLDFLSQHPLTASHMRELSLELLDVVSIRLLPIIQHSKVLVHHGKLVEEPASRKIGQGSLCRTRRRLRTFSRL
jgi:hypothetical protein